MCGDVIAAPAQLNDVAPLDIGKMKNETNNQEVAHCSDSDLKMLVASVAIRCLITAQIIGGTYFHVSIISLHTLLALCSRLSVFSFNSNCKE